MPASRWVFRAFGAQEFTAFLGAREHADLTRIAGALPFAVQAHGLELKLWEGGAHADYLVCLDAAARETVESMRAFVAAKERAGASLSSVDTYLRRWCSASSAQRRRFPQLWLEWDRPEGKSASAPGLFLAPAPSRRGLVPGATLRGALRTLYPERPARRAEAWIARIVGLLPPGARLRHAGAMPGRDPDLLRLVLEDVPPERLVPLLRRIRWPGDVRALERLLSETAGKTGCIPTLLDLDLLDRPLPALGLEFLLVGAHRPEDGGARLLEYLREKGWVSPKKARALARWLTWDVRDAPGADPGALWGKLYHVKLSLSRSGAADAPPVRAKAYLGFFGGPRSQGLSTLHQALRARLSHQPPTNDP
jgi:hypothetical protein